MPRDVITTVTSRMCSRHHMLTLTLLHPADMEGVLMAGTLRKVDIRTDSIDLWSAILNSRN